MVPVDQIRANCGPMNYYSGPQSFHNNLSKSKIKRVVILNG